MMHSKRLLPIDIGADHLSMFEGKVISHEPYVRLLSEPTYNGEIWTALAQVDNMLCVVQVGRKEEQTGDKP